jgi:hypothetical protein
MSNKKIFLFILTYTLVFTLPIIVFIFSRIPGEYADTYQVWGKTLEFRNLIDDEGILGAINWQIKNFRCTPIETIGWVQEITNPFMGYNLVWLFSFFLAAWGMYKLAYYLIKSRFAALVAGIIFSFSPFHFSQGVSTNIGTMHYEWIPFFILYLFKFLRNYKLKDFLLTILFLVLIALAEHQLLAFTLVLTVILIITFIFKNFRTLFRFKFWLYGVGGIFVLLLAIKFIFGGLLTVTKSGDNYLDPGSDQVRRYSTDAIDFFIPSLLNPFWGEKFNYLRADTEANEAGRQSNYIGYTVMFLALLSLVEVLFTRKRWAIKTFFLFGGVFFAILSMGPYLHWKGEVNKELWMPYSFLYDHLPFWYIIRTVNRLYVISLLGFALSAGFGLNYVLKMFSNKNKKAFRRKKEFRGTNLESDSLEQGNSFTPSDKNITKGSEINKKRNLQFYREQPHGILENKPRFFITAIFVLLISLEYLSLPVPSFSLNYSSFYDNLAEEEGNFSILDIPGATSYDYSSKLMFYNQIHRKNNLAGMDFARVVEGKWDFQKQTPILNDLLYSLSTGGTPPKKEIINDYYYNLATKILNFYDIKYIIVSKGYLEDEKKFDEEAYKNTLNFIEEELDADSVYEDSFLVAFKINPSEHLDGWFLAMDLKNGSWDIKEGKLGSVARWAKDGASLKLVNMGAETQNLTLSFQTRIKNLLKVEVFLNGVKQDSLKIKKEKEEHSVLLEEVKPGDNQIVFRIFDLEGNPIENYELKRGVKFSNLRTTSSSK